MVPPPGPLEERRRLKLMAPHSQSLLDQRDHQQATTTVPKKTLVALRVWFTLNQV